MATSEEIRHDIAALHREGEALLVAFAKGHRSVPFETEYQGWYTRSLPVVRQVAPDRYAEFRSYYEMDSRAQGHWSHAYVIQHYIKGIDPFLSGEYDIRELAAKCFSNQLAIFASLLARLDYALLDMEVQIQVALQAAELESARALIKLDARAAGIIAGAVLESHLKRLVRRHRIKVFKQKPALQDLNDALKRRGIYAAEVWSQVGWLAQLRGHCVAEPEPSAVQARDLIDGAGWLIQNVF